MNTVLYRVSSVENNAIRPVINAFGVTMVPVFQWILSAHRFWKITSCKGWFVVFSDITERKREEQKLNNALSEIEQLKNRLQAENIYLQEQVNLNHTFEDILGQSQPVKSVLRQVEQVAPTDTTVLNSWRNWYRVKNCLRVRYIISAHVKSSSGEN